MNVWIFALSAIVFSPVIEPLGLHLGTPSTSLEAASTDLVSVPMVDMPTVELPPGMPPMRYRGIERLFEKLEASDK